jgi:hypothetical protein
VESGKALCVCGALWVAARRLRITRPLYGAYGKECANICHIDSGAHRAIARMKFEVFRGSLVGVSSVDFSESSV